MITTVTATSHPEQTWQQTAIAELEVTLGQALDVWNYNASSCGTSNRWSRQEWSTGSGAPGLAKPVVNEPSSGFPALLDSAIAEMQAVTCEQTQGKHLLAIPLDSQTVATTTVLTDNPAQLTRLANVAGRYFHQQEEVLRLREENDFFLKQVSDDFEELTFLRSMAQQLGLGDSTHTVEQLVNATLPELGKSSHAEELYFVLQTEDGKKILSEWYSEFVVSEFRGTSLVMLLLEQYCDAARIQSVIKNAFDATDEGESFPGIRDFVIVPVGDGDAPLGWFLAVNRLPEDQSTANSIPEWRLNQHEFGTSEASLLSTAAAMIASHANNLALFQERETLLVNVVRTLVSAVEAKDQYTCGHSERVALYAKRLAEEVGYDEEACELLYLTGLLHDIGKIAISDAILNKPDRLTNDEFAEIQLHPEDGWIILQDLKQLNYVLPGVLHHHERIDGKGYPDGLMGEDIPLDGRVLAVADAYDAMTSDRAYRNGMPHEKAISIIREGAGSQWDANAVKAFLEIEADITSIRNNYRPRQQPNRTPTVGDSATS